MAGEQVLVIDDSPTILKVVQLVLSKAGYSVRTASDGEEGISAAREQRPDLILLDFVMPKMNGYQVCSSLAASELRDVPVVLMSAKGDQVGERFVKVMGIVDYITKPFSPESITAVVDHSIAKYGHPKRSAEAATENGFTAPSTVAGADEDTPVETGSQLTEPRMIEAIRRRQQALAALREALARALTTDEPGDPLPDRVRDKLHDELLEAALRELGLASEPDVVLEGDLQAVPLAEVLGLLHQQQQTGILSVQHDLVRAELHFRKGKVEFAGATVLGEEFLLGRYLIAQESISRQNFDLFLQSRAKPGRPIGEQLLTMNFVSQNDLRQALSRQTCERIYEALRWPCGRFAFRATPDLGALADGASLGLSVDTILLEGVRRVDEWHVIERQIDDFDAVFLRNEEMVQGMVQGVGRGSLTREEHSVLDLVNGRNNVRDIVRQTRMGSFEVSKMLFRLRSINLIRRRVAPVAV